MQSRLHHLMAWRLFLDYNEQSAVAELIKQFKYQFAYDINNVWQKIINLSLDKIILQMEMNSTSPTVIPVPLHKNVSGNEGLTRPR